MRLPPSLAVPHQLGTTQGTLLGQMAASPTLLPHSNLCWQKRCQPTGRKSLTLEGDCPTRHSEQGWAEKGERESGAP
ncbi:hypothetical protein ROHU_025137 [Labeo rohita]|uniref:Uncharacterized protein n=1 Tax=Labeo rohita TaxID=84645 RepID=A0A498MGA7_LABRO|nr:hypothetical protein ROHU_025137 [Labeo rohita]